MDNISKKTKIAIVSNLTKSAKPPVPAQTAMKTSSKIEWLASMSEEFQVEEMSAVTSRPCRTLGQAIARLRSMCAKLSEKSNDSMSEFRDHAFLFTEEISRDDPIRSILIYHMNMMKIEYRYHRRMVKTDNLVDPLDSSH